MPQRPNKPCRHRGCNALTRNANGYCDGHQADAAPWQHDKSSAERGLGAAWRRKRSFVLRRDGGICQCAECKRLGRTLVATEVDHIIPRFEGGTSDSSNLQAINHDCHKIKTQAESKRARSR